MLLVPVLEKPGRIYVKQYRGLNDSFSREMSIGDAENFKDDYERQKFAESYSTEALPSTKLQAHTRLALF